MPGLMAIREKVRTAGKPCRVCGDWFVAHDDPDRGVDRDAHCARRRCSLGQLQYFFNSGSRGRSHGPGAASASSPGKARSLEEYWWCTQSAPSRFRTARARNSWSMMAATRPCLFTKATNWKKARLGEDRLRQTRKSKSSRICSGSAARESLSLARDGEGLAGCVGRDHDRCASALQDARGKVSCSFRRSTSTIQSPNRSSTTFTAAGIRWSTD